MSKQSESVRKFFRDNDINQREFADKYKLDKSTLSNCLNGRRGFPDNLAVALNKEFGMDVGFILTGEGFLFRASRETVTQVANNVTTNNQIVGDAATAAALKAENERLRNEVEWLRELLAKK